MKIKRALKRGFAGLGILVAIIGAGGGNLRVHAQGRLRRIDAAIRP
jgi:hypothetical protein